MEQRKRAAQGDIAMAILVVVLLSWVAGVALSRARSRQPALSEEERTRIAEEREAKLAEAHDRIIRQRRETEAREQRIQKERREREERLEKARAAFEKLEAIGNERRAAALKAERTRGGYYDCESVYVSVFSGTIRELTNMNPGHPTPDSPGVISGNTIRKRPVYNRTGGRYRAVVADWRGGYGDGRRHQRIVTLEFTISGRSADVQLIVGPDSVSVRER